MGKMRRKRQRKRVGQKTRWSQEFVTQGSSGRSSGAALEKPKYRRITGSEYNIAAQRRVTETDKSDLDRLYERAGEAGIHLHTFEKVFGPAPDASVVTEMDPRMKTEIRIQEIRRSAFSEKVHNWLHVVLFENGVRTIKMWFNADRYIITEETAIRIRQSRIFTSRDTALKAYKLKLIPWKHTVPVRAIAAPPVL